MGNHDDREAYSQILMDTSPTQQPQDAVYDLAGLRVIALDTSVPGYHHGELTSDQQEWLRAELATPAPHGTLLAMHHPPIPTPIELMGLIELEDQAGLAGVITGSDVRGILAGHLHYSTFSTFSGVPVSVAAAACYNIDLVGPKTTLLSAKTTGSAASLVHVYPEQVVFSEVPLDDVAEIMSYDAGYLATIEAMSPQERRAMFSKKDSDFNRADDQAHSGS
jgi:CBS domain-containing protein